MKYKRENGIWYYRDPITPRKSLGTKNLRIATQLENELIVRYQKYKAGLITRSDATKVIQEYTVDEVYSKFYNAELKNKKRTVYYTSKFKPFKQLFGKLDISCFSYENACQYREYLLGEKKYTTKTAHNHLAEIKRMFEWAVNTKIIEDNPFAVKNYMPSTRATNPRQDLPIEVVQRAIDLAPTEKDAILWTVMLHTGLRTNQAGNLEPSHVKAGLYQEKSKTYRKIPYTDALKELGSKIYNCMPSKGMQETSVKRFREIVLREFPDYQKENAPRVDLHSIRHTLFTLLVKGGFDRKSVGEITATETEVARYAHIDMSQVEDVINKELARA